jgi:hypothetical protein
MPDVRPVCKGTVVDRLLSFFFVEAHVSPEATPIVIALDRFASTNAVFFRHRA